MYNFLISRIRKLPTSINYWTEKLNLNLDTEWDQIFSFQEELQQR